MANEELARQQRNQEIELASYLESIESAKWNAWQNVKFIYNLEIEFETFNNELDKFGKMLGEMK